MRSESVLMKILIDEKEERERECERGREEEREKERGERKRHQWEFKLICTSNKAIKPNKKIQLEAKNRERHERFEHQVGFFLRK